MQRNCQACGIIFRARGERKGKPRKFCSRKCYGNYKKAHPEMYPTLFKTGHPCFGAPPKWNELSKESKEKRIKSLRKSLKNNPKFKLAHKLSGLRMRGSNHWNWKGGKSEVNHRLRNENESKEWREKVYKRDYWTCQKCGYKGHQIVAHHILDFNNYPDLRFDVNNGVTLCRSCHKREHSEIGKETRFGTHYEMEIYQDLDSLLRGC
jgi:hypothetical protein